MHSLLYCSKSYLLRKPVIVALCLYRTSLDCWSWSPGWWGNLPGFAYAMDLHMLTFQSMPVYSSIYDWWLQSNHRSLTTICHHQWQWYWFVYISAVILLTCKQRTLPINYCVRGGHKPARWPWPTSPMSAHRHTDRHMPMTTRPCGLRRAGNYIISVAYTHTRMYMKSSFTKPNKNSKLQTVFCRLSRPAVCVRVSLGPKPASVQAVFDFVSAESTAEPAPHAVGTKHHHHHHQSLYIVTINARLF